jgi:hypothetical protein
MLNAFFDIILYTESNFVINMKEGSRFRLPSLEYFS